MSAPPPTALHPGPSSPAGTGQAGVRYDVEAARQQFPVLAERPYGKPLAYLGSAATSQKLQVVIGAMSPLVAGLERAQEAFG